MYYGLTESSSGSRELQRQSSLIKRWDRASLQNPQADRENCNHINMTRDDFRCAVLQNPQADREYCNAAAVWLPVGAYRILKRIESIATEGVVARWDGVFP